MKSVHFIIFGLTVTAQWAASLSQIWTHEKVLSQGTLIKLKCAAPDPYDPLRGRFLAVRPVETHVEVPAGVEVARGADVFITLTPDANGLSKVTSLGLTPPASGIYLKVRTSLIYGESTIIEWPFDRFYLNEKLAPEADKWFAENIRSATGITAEVRVLNGRAVLQDLSLNGRSFRDLLKERQN
jgi:GDYXXLXY protein